MEVDRNNFSSSALSKNQDLGNKPARHNIKPYAEVVHQKNSSKEDTAQYLQGRVPETNNGGDATPDGSNSGDFEVCNNDPKSPISEGSRGIKKASKSFKECGGISQGDLNVDCALNQDGKRKESTGQMRSDTRGCLTTPDAVTRKETELQKSYLEENLKMGLC
ncbi:hypothetical protein Ancab_025267 [Ancistrocladus abbreviatus]